MNFLLRLGGWITDHPKSAFALVFLAGGLLGVLAGRRQTPSLKEEVKASEAAFGREALTEKKTEGPWTRETWEYGAPSVPTDGVMDADAKVPTAAHVQADPEQLAHISGFTAAATQAQGPLIRFSVESHEGTASETHAETSAAQTSTQSLKLSQEANGASWGLSVGVADLRERQLHLGLRRRLFGPFWLEAGVTPATRAVGAGLSVQW